MFWVEHAHSISNKNLTSFLEKENKTNHKLLSWSAKVLRSHIHISPYKHCYPEDRYHTQKWNRPSACACQSLSSKIIHVRNKKARRLYLVREKTKFTLLQALHSPDALNTEYHIVVKTSFRTFMNNLASWS